MNESLQARHTSRRVPGGPLRLAAPLRFRWALKGGRPATGLPVVKGDAIIAFQGERLVAVCLDSEGGERWRLPRECSNAAIVDDQAVIALYEGGLLVTNLATGRGGREEPVERGFSVIVGDGLIERGWPEPTVCMRSLSPRCP